MSKSKKLDLRSFTKLTNLLTKQGETIRTRQDEKQSVMDDFDKEKKEYRRGKISETTLSRSSKKSNGELKRLNHDINNTMASVRSTSKKLLDLTSRQRPIHFVTSVKGIKKPVKKKAKKKK